MKAVLSNRAVAARPSGGEAIHRHRGEVVLRVLVGSAIVAAIVVAVLTPTFLTAANIKAVLLNASLTGIVAVAMTPMTLSGNFVSLATQQTALGAAMLLVVLLNHGMSVALGTLAILVLLVTIGVLQALFVAAGLNPVITTLAAGSIILGATNTIDHGNPISLNTGIGWGNASVAGVPVEVFVMLVFAAAVTVLVHRTTLGRRIVLTGANRAAAEVSGISHGMVTIAAFVIFSVGVAIVSLLYVAGYGNVTPDSMSSLTLDAIAALLVGGTAIGGGAGSPWRSAAGAVFISVVTNVLLLRHLDPGQAQAFVGAIVTAAVVLLVVTERRWSAR